MDRRLIAMRLAAVALASLAIACGFGAEESAGSTGETGVGTSGSSTGSAAVECGIDSQLENGRCYCTPGRIWTDPFDPASYDCETPARQWPPCRRFASDPPNVCECDDDLPLPADAMGCESSTAAVQECKPATGDKCECMADDDATTSCACPGAVTCTCPPYFTWCSYEDLANLACCYDPAQDPDGTHDPAATTETSSADDTSSDDASSSGTSSGATTSGGTTSSDTTSGGTTSDGPDTTESTG